MQKLRKHCTNILNVCTLNTYTYTYFDMYISREREKLSHQLKSIYQCFRFTLTRVHSFIHSCCFFLFLYTLPPSVFHSLYSLHLIFSSFDGAKFTIVLSLIITFCMGFYNLFASIAQKFHAESFISSIFSRCNLVPFHCIIQSWSLFFCFISWDLSHSHSHISNVC